MLDATVIKHRLIFNFDAGTSRGVLKHKDCWYLVLKDKKNPAKQGIGECSPIPGLSLDDLESLDDVMKRVVDHIREKKPPGLDLLERYPAVYFAYETAWRNYENPGMQLFESAFYKGEEGIPINGLIWMGDKAQMLERISEKVDAGFRCLKLKVGAINFEDEIALLKAIRKDFPGDELEIRLDANGAFAIEEALEKLKRLSDYQIHSIEQPIHPGQPGAMNKLCRESPLPVALDEELIGHFTREQKRQLIKAIAPTYLILKPTLLGGFGQCEEWIQIARDEGIGWWATSFLESNVGLNAIAQWTAHHEVDMVQGLGTGGLFTNNISSPLTIRGQSLWYDRNKNWDLSLFS